MPPKRRTKPGARNGSGDSWIWKALESKRNANESSSSLQPFMLAVAVVLLGCYFGYYIVPSQRSCSEVPTTIVKRLKEHPMYNDTYPISPPLRFDDGRTVFKIALVSDLDTDSKHLDQANTWRSVLKTGYLTVDSSANSYEVEFDEDDVTLMSKLAEKGRGLELSDLVVFNGKLLSCDDRTGAIFEIPLENINAAQRPSTLEVLPWTLLRNGPGNVAKGFKCEWLTVREGELWAGSLGKEWTTATGVRVNDYPQWVKTVGPWGDVLHVNFVEEYNKLRDKAGFQEPGYIIHEAAIWSKVHNKWYFLPRRASGDTYDEVSDERRATNILFASDATFSDVSITRVGSLNQVRGYSAFRFVPGSGDRVAIALKTEEDRGRIASFITVFNTDGKVLMPDMLVSDTFKFEGIEFV